MADDRQKKLDAVVAANFDLDSLADDKGREDWLEGYWFALRNLNDEPVQADLALLTNVEAVSSAAAQTGPGPAPATKAGPPHGSHWLLAACRGCDYVVQIDIADTEHNDVREAAEEIRLHMLGTDHGPEIDVFAEMTAPVPSRREVEGGAP